MPTVEPNVRVDHRNGHPQWRTLGDSHSFSSSDYDLEKPPPPEVSVVVVFWAQSSPFGTCLQKIRQAGHRIDDALEVIVVNNGCGAELADRLVGLWDRWIEVSENVGPARARNLGARAARAPIVAFVDDDGHVDPDYFTRALEYFEDPRVLGIRGRVQPRNHPFLSALATHYDRGAEPLPDALITEGASLVRRRAFLDVHGFPEGVDGHEGIELTYRLLSNSARGTTLYAPDVLLSHDYVDGLREFVAKSIRHAQNEVDLDSRDPDAADFLRAYFKQSFPRRSLSPPQWLARHGLRLLRFLLQSAARLQARIAPGGSQ